MRWTDLRKITVAPSGNQPANTQPEHERKASQGGSPSVLDERRIRVELRCNALEGWDGIRIMESGGWVVVFAQNWDKCYLYEEKGFEDLDGLEGLEGPHATTSCRTALAVDHRLTPLCYPFTIYSCSIIYVQIGTTGEFIPLTSWCNPCVRP